MGERLAIDPNNNSIIYLGARSGNGLWKSTNAGATWAKVTAFPDAGTYIPDPTGMYHVILIISVFLIMRQIPTAITATKSVLHGSRLTTLPKHLPALLESLPVLPVLVWQMFIKPPTAVPPGPPFQSLTAHSFHTRGSTHPKKESWFAHVSTLLISFFGSLTL